MITVVSACYGGYDTPALPPQQDTEVEWVMVTDGLVDVPAPWREVVEERTHLHPRMAAKVPKCLPHRYVSDSEAVIWLDASAVILRADFVSACVAALGDGDVAQWVHPERNDILDEAIVSERMAKYGRQSVVRQAEFYRTVGHPANYGLWATGCMTWRLDDPVRTVTAGAAWLDEQTIFTYQDQISWPVIVRTYDLDVRPMPGGLWDRNYVAFRPHVSHQ